MGVATHSFPSPGDLPDPGIKSRSPALQADSLPSEPPGKPRRGSEANKQKGSIKREMEGTANAWERGPKGGVMREEKGVGSGRQQGDDR